jgi:ferredoxin
MPTVRVWDGAAWHTLKVAAGANLRQVLLAHALSPYTAITRRLNCGGRGLCATCGVRIASPAPKPTHWHDALAAHFGYPRLSCQITIDRDLEVRLLPDKRIWGSRAS